MGTVYRRTVERTLAAVVADSIAPDTDADREPAPPVGESGDGTHHPGPPRFMHVGEAIADPLGQEAETRDSLAPWNPDVEGTYSWSIADAPEGADPTLSGDAVAEFDPDVPGTYRLELEAPDGTHSLTVRVYPAVDESEPRPHVSLDAAVADGEVLLSATARLDPAERDENVDGEPDSTTGNERDKTTKTELTVEFFIDDRHWDRLTNLDSPIGPADIDDRVRVYAVAVGSRHSVPSAIDLVPDGDSIRAEHPYDSPDWVENAVIYEIFTRRFPDQDDPTFETIADRIDHLAELGVDAVWLTPFLATDRGFGTPPAEGGPHGYHTTDYFAVDPDLGTMAEFEALVDTCHDHGIKVLFDLVINHTADSHPFAEAATDPNHPAHETYVDWYRWDDRDALEYDFYFGWTGIPNLNFNNLAVRAFALDVIEFWAEKVDGIRADVAWGVPKSLWQEVADRLHSRDPDFLLLDETLPYDVELMTEFGLHYDGHLHTALGAAATGNPDVILDAIDRRSSAGAPDHAHFLQYIENHDTDRYRTAYSPEAQRAAVAATFTLPGVPMIYYGQETGVRKWREPMNWGAFDADLVAFHQRLIDFYHDHPALGARGQFERIAYRSKYGGATAFARSDPETGARLVVMLNFDPEAQSVTIGERVDDTNLLDGSTVPIAVDAAAGVTEVAVETVVVLAAEDDR